MKSGCRNALSVRIRVAALVLFTTAAGTVLHAQRADSLPVGVRAPVPRADTAGVFSAALNLSAGCQLSRVVAVGLAGYLGYLIAGLAQYPLELEAGSRESVAVDIAGAVTGVILIADAPMSRALPFCPESLRTLSNRPTNHGGACRASRVLNAGLGAAVGAVAAGAVAIPFVVFGRGRDVVNELLIVLPVAGTISGAIRAGKVPPCTS